MDRRVVAWLCGAALGFFAADENAAIWAWGCQGQLGPQLVIFNRDTMYVVEGKLPQSARRDRRKDLRIGQERRRRL
jgi:hypothetical protein